MTMLWSSPEAMEELLCELVGWESRTFSQGERDFPVKLQEKLKLLPYFKEHPNQINLHEADEGRRSLTALYRHSDPNVTKTIVMLSHFDTVQTEEYGHLTPFAFDPHALTTMLAEVKETLPKVARDDLDSGEYLFGRGVMDMKMGLVLHMHLIEQAIREEWKVNLLLLTVPDEEVNSVGMRTMLPHLLTIQEGFDLKYSLFFNSEPSFTQRPGDETHYIYTGTMGKIMPGALFFGKETHVGEPLSGITASYMSSYLSQDMEWNPAFRENELGESTPLPVSLQLKDLKLEYSTQTPYRAAALYNIFTMKKDAASVMDTFEAVVEKSVARCQADYDNLCERENVQGFPAIRVVRYDELFRYVQDKFDDTLVEEATRLILDETEWDDRDKSIRMAGEWMLLCPELAPAVVLFYAPPYYPSVNSSDDPRCQEAVAAMKKVGEEEGLPVEHIHYFNGICDLSYVNYEKSTNELEAYRQNTPVWGHTYTVPFEAMSRLQAPVLNIGPFGKDPHQRTERLHRHNAFVHTPKMLHELMRIWRTEGKVRS
ncbi:M20/M25/M40 family metallo-hydrolase [Salipaludibacillus daqingensis]|uniref:M20/M25/M40 family metallo-hydrolase n=1 Tax=Salipaludibacillus daqingensis TaxID=3041001 RepID=UPI002475F6EB|nr:M20/M25/M40 family metallo-hydrolase [Salipaludibacillus daqingensis]